MLFPQFSLRLLLALITGCSLAFLALAYAVRGNPWAIGVAIGLSSLIAIGLVQGFTFLLVWLFAQLTAWIAQRRARKGLLLLPLLFATSAWAGGVRETVPTNGKPASNGGFLMIDSRWGEGYGYQPLTYKVVGSPSPADRTLTIELTCRNWDSRPMKVLTQLELPAGVTGAQTTIAIPLAIISADLELDVWEDGQYVPEFHHTIGGRGMRSVSAAQPIALFIAARQPDVSTLASLFSTMSYRYTPQVTPASPAPVPFPDEWHWCSTADLPDQWLSFQSLDLIFLSETDAQVLATTSPTVWEALRSWNRAGGNLILYDVALERLADVERLLKLREGQSWQVPRSEDFRDGFADTALNMVIDEPMVVEYDADDADPDAEPDAHVPKLQAPAEGPMRWTYNQLGTVTVLSTPNPFDSSFPAENWYWILNSLGTNRWLMAKRLGIDMDGDTTNFWRFQIPGVGSAPVNTYRVLITVFVVLIGPVNYLLLRRKGRLHLLLLTVPASALLVSGALLAYALVADGLHTRVRVRSVTLLDQQSGDGVTLSRQVYYAGMAPSDGLTFSRDTAVLPFDPRFGSIGDHRREIDIDPTHQRFTRGWLASRTPTQFYTAHPYQSEASLRVTCDDKQVQVTNELKEDIEYLLLADDSGKFVWGADIAAGEQITLQRPAQTPQGTQRSPDPMLSAMQQFFLDQALASPDVALLNRSRGLFTPRAYYSYHNNNSQIVVVMEESQLEQKLSQASNAVSYANLGHGPADAALPPRSYVAIVSRPAEVEVGLDDVTETDSLHVILGTW